MQINISKNHAGHANKHAKKYAKKYTKNMHNMQKICKFFIAAKICIICKKYAGKYARNMQKICKEYAQYAEGQTNMRLFQYAQYATLDHHHQLESVIMICYYVTHFGFYFSAVLLHFHIPRSAQSRFTVTVTVVTVTASHGYYYY